ncbi:HlyD family efflux transporter periplasmic adaptor subunit [Leptolyngbya sp. BC1307]|uniref:efflux RND transporter periplasmic adaptor subunit n=1 Tax=Leptolyngbya sp. BC1307 TaxID=2029589 RepID=UPI000EFBE84B|nr:HlyD family efflux transporter periplasmic adaptor subunit [Leptolyngbya sp. BC1307]
MATTSSQSDLSESASRYRGRFNFTVGWRKWMLLLPLALLPVIWVVRNGGETAEVAEAQQALPVETMRLQSEDSYVVERVYTGEIVARRSSELGFERAGTVMALLADEGDVVAAGGLLARLDMRDLEAQRQQLEAQKRQVLAQLQELETGPRREDISAAQAAVSDLDNQLELAQLQANRRAELYAQGAISKEELDEKQFGANAIAERLQQAQSQLDKLRNGTRQEQVSAQVAEVDQIDARIRALDISLDKSVLTAPFSGKVSSRAVDEGTVVGSGQQVVTLVENGTVEARVGVPAAVSQRLATGSRQSVQVGGRTYLAVVTARLPIVDEASQTVTVVLELADDAEVTIGATARLLTDEQQTAAGYWLPSTALVAGDRGLWSVYVLSPDDSDTYRVARRDVAVLHTEGDRSFVRGLVEGGDRIITSGTHRVVADQLVTPREE